MANLCLSLSKKDMLIGMDVAIRELLELVNLKEFGVNDKVISIVGCPGLGKTTLAKAFSDLEMIRERFNPPVWVSASKCRSAQDLLRDENGRKQSVNTKTITVFIFFIGNKIENGNSGNGNDIGISETSETKVWCGKYTGNGRNLKYNR
jgi:AAA15 family ATPase/GTPase